MILPRYEIIDIDPFTHREHEQMGSKAKFWCRIGTEKWLFKQCRPGTGEDWAEKIAAEVAALLGLPHARVELAALGETRGSISLDFAAGSDLIHGNELLWRLDPSYPLTKSWGAPHTLSRMF
jgi:hypothetical protein